MRAKDLPSVRDRAEYTVEEIAHAIAPGAKTGDIGRAVVAELLPDWVLCHRSDGDGYTLPTEPGWYAITFAGGTELINGHTVRAYPEYIALGRWVPGADDTDGYSMGSFTDMAENDDPEYILAWCGPLLVPDTPFRS